MADADADALGPWSRGIRETAARYAGRATQRISRSYEGSSIGPAPSGHLGQVASSPRGADSQALPRSPTIPVGVVCFAGESDFLGARTHGWTEHEFPTTPGTQIRLPRHAGHHGDSVPVPGRVQRGSVRCLQMTHSIPWHVGRTPLRSLSFPAHLTAPSSCPSTASRNTPISSRTSSAPPPRTATFKPSKCRSRNPHNVQRPGRFLSPTPETSHPLPASSPPPETGTPPSYTDPAAPRPIIRGRYGVPR